MREIGKRGKRGNRQGGEGRTIGGSKLEERKK